MRNRRVRLLLLAVVITITFFLYSRSDPKTIDQAKRYAQNTYKSALDQTLGKQKPAAPPANAAVEPVAPVIEAKKDEPFRVDFGAYSRAAAGLLEETSDAAAIPPPAAAPIQPPPAVETKTPAAAAPGPVETKKDDPMRVDFAAYSKAAAAEAEERKSPPDALKMDVVNPNPVAGVPGVKEPATPAKKPDSKPKQKGVTQQQPAINPEMFAEPILPVGEGRVEVDVLAQETAAPVHWSKFPEKFPVTSTRAFPINLGTNIPKIQHDFSKTPAAIVADEEKLAQIRAATRHAWTGYRNKAMGHDEIKPVSGQFVNPFNAWGATLIDSLDTLWLMGLLPEFEEAIEHVKKVDFTTSRRADIPIFETTIRYLGGLLGAYDISGRNYDVLLQKAKQLGEVLFAAFDTPNRMPMTYYQWKPAFASQGRRASPRTIMSELGSLSLELTRLGQLVGDAKYFDAISRITDALDEFQGKTRIPGLWPAQLDASGCKVTNKAADNSAEQGEKPKLKDAAKPDPKVVPEVQPGKNREKAPKVADAAVDVPLQASKSEDTPLGLGQAGIGKIQGFGVSAETDPYAGPKDSVLKQAADGAAAIMRRALDAANELLEPRADSATKKSGKSKDETTSNSELSGVSKDGSRAASQAVVNAEDVCVPQGLATHEYSADVFTFGAAADSTYEYLPKMHVLLGGKVDQYRKMYTKAIDASYEWLVYRAMIPDETRELFFAGNVDTKAKFGAPDEITRTFSPVGSHLTCFVGGMFAMGGKIFNRPKDIETARKLTDGCIWAYNVTTTGIMPEIFSLVKCPSTQSCKWDKAAYYKELDPFVEARLAGQKDKSSKTETAFDAPAFGAEKPAIGQAAAGQAIAPPAGLAAGQAIAPPAGLAAGKAGLQKRQFGGGEAQYGVQTAPNAAPAAAITILAEVPPLGMAAPGLPNAAPNAPAAEEPILNIHDTGANKQFGAALNAPNTPEPPNTPFAKPVEPDVGKTNQVPPAFPAGADPKLPIGADAPVNDLQAGLKPSKPVDTTADAPQPVRLSHEEFAKQKIEEDRLPPGMVGMHDRRYQLRPEAIESVFYMYRITGEQYWRDRGWEMWNAVYKHTWAPFGATAIDDISKTAPGPAVSTLPPTRSYCY